MCCPPQSLLKISAESSLKTEIKQKTKVEPECDVFTYDEVRLECRLIETPSWYGGLISSDDRVCGQNDDESSGRFCTSAMECRPRVCEECDTTGYTRHEGCTWPGGDLLDNDGNPLVFFNVLGKYNVFNPPLGPIEQRCSL